jgi:hypothetical protein
MKNLRCSRMRTMSEKTLLEGRASITILNDWEYSSRSRTTILDKLLDDSIVYNDVSKRNLILTSINNFMINATNPPRNLEEKIDDANSRINTIKTNYIKNSDKISIFFATMNYIYTFESSVDNTNQLDENTRSLIKNIIDNKKENINAYTTLGNIIQIYFKDPGQLARDAVVASTDKE